MVVYALNYVLNYAWAISSCDTRCNEYLKLIYRVSNA